LRYNRTTGLMITQMQELVRRVNEALDEPWNKHIGRPKSLGLYKAVEAACMYLRQNATQEFIGDARDTSQPTISRYTAALVPIVKSVLEEFVPDAAEAIEMVRGRVVLVDGTLTPCQGFVKVAGGVQPGERPVRLRIWRARRGSWAQRRVSSV
jgi:hypothetical protein